MSEVEWWQTVGQQEEFEHDRALRLESKFGGEWRAWPGNVDYFFCVDGRAASWIKGPRLLVGCTCGIGYRAVSVSMRDGTFDRVYIHRAVCELFNGPATEPGMHCRHLDGDLTNNSADNLAWGTALENMGDMKRHGKTGVGERNPMAKLTAAKVRAMRRDRLESDASYRSIAKRYGVSTMTAYRAITGESWT